MIVLQGFVQNPLHQLQWPRIYPQRRAPPGVGRLPGALWFSARRYLFPSTHQGKLKLKLILKRCLILVDTRTTLSTHRSLRSLHTGFWGKWKKPAKGDNSYLSRLSRISGWERKVKCHAVVPYWLSILFSPSDIQCLLVCLNLFSRSWLGFLPAGGTQVVVLAKAGDLLLGHKNMDGQKCGLHLICARCGRTERWVAPLCGWFCYNNFLSSTWSCSWPVRHRRKPKLS